MAAHLEQALGLRAELVRGEAGVFDVDADGERVFSKQETGRFPEPLEIEATLRARSAAKR